MSGSLSTSSRLVVHRSAPVPRGDGAEPFRVAADEDRLGNQRCTVRGPHPALVPDGEHRPEQVLPVTHAASDTIHRDVDDLVRHLFSPKHDEILGKRLPTLGWSGTLGQEEGRASRGPNSGEDRGAAPQAAGSTRRARDLAGCGRSVGGLAEHGFRVVNDGSPQVGPALADRVRKAVAELGYTADLQARAVATGRSALVGVIVHDISDPYFSSIAAGVIEVARSRQLLACMSSIPAARGGGAPRRGSGTQCRAGSGRVGLRGADARSAGQGDDLDRQQVG